MTNSVILCARSNEVQCSRCRSSTLWWIEASCNNGAEPLKVVGLKSHGPFLHPVFSDFAFDGLGVILDASVFMPGKTQIHILEGEVAICPRCNGAIVFKSEDARVEIKEVGQ